MDDLKFHVSSPVFFPIFREKNSTWLSRPTFGLPRFSKINQSRDRSRRISDTGRWTWPKFLIIQSTSIHLYDTCPPYVRSSSPLPPAYRFSVSWICPITRKDYWPKFSLLAKGNLGRKKVWNNQWKSTWSEKSDLKFWKDSFVIRILINNKIQIV